MARMSLERAIQIMVNAGFTYEMNHGSSKHYFMNNKNGVQKSFSTGREVVQFVKSKGGCTTDILDWQRKLTGANPMTGKKEYVNVITGERYYCTENDLEFMFS